MLSEQVRLLKDRTGKNVLDKRMAESFAEQNR